MAQENNKPPWLMPKPARKRSDRKEAAVARRLGARQNAGSGSKSKKYDMTTEDFLVEHKYTDKGSYSIKLDYWQDIVRQAKKQGKSPAMVIEIQGVELAVVGFDVFQSMTNGE